MITLAGFLRLLLLNLRLHTSCQDCRVLDVQTHIPLVMPTTSSMKIFTMKISTAGMEVAIRQSKFLVWLFTLHLCCMARSFQ